MITRRSVLLAGGVGLLVADRLSRGQPAATIRRVGMMFVVSETAGANLRAAFKQGMQDLGWLEGKNVEYRFVHADGDASREDDTDRDDQCIERRAHRVYSESIQAGGQHHRHYQSARRVSLGKVIEILHAVAPGARRIAILLNENNPSYAVFWAAAQSACAALDLVALRFVASAPAQLGAAVEEIVRQRSQAVVVVQDGLYFAERAKLQELMQATWLPVAYQNRDQVVAGGLLGYATDLAASFRYAAKYVDRILKGARPADLSVEQPTRFELVINMKTAKALAITIPQSLLLRADEVIE